MCCLLSIFFLAVAYHNLFDRMTDSFLRYFYLFNYVESSSLFRDVSIVVNASEWTSCKITWFFFTLFGVFVLLVQSRSLLIDDQIVVDAFLGH